MPLVVDSSALVFATVDRSAAAERLLGRLGEEVCHAPHLIDAEFGNALRSLVARNEVLPDMARAMLDVGAEFIDHRYEPHGFLASMAWHLRDAVSFYDALYVALAANFDMPLVTVDRRLARVRGLPCRVEVPAGL